MTELMLEAGRQAEPYPNSDINPNLYPSSVPATNKSLQTKTIQHPYLRLNELAGNWSVKYVFGNVT